MMCRCFSALYVGIVTCGCLLLTEPWAGFEPEREASPARVGLGEVLNREIAAGMLGGVRCDALVDSLPAVAGCGGWSSSAYDPDERCWYLTGWIDDECADRRRMSLALWPSTGNAGGRAWRFHLLCTSLAPAVLTSVDIEGAWRSADGRIRVVWTESKGGTEEAGNLQTRLIAQDPYRNPLAVRPERLNGSCLSSGR